MDDKLLKYIELQFEMSQLSSGLRGNSRLLYFQITEEAGAIEKTWADLIQEKEWSEKVVVSDLVKRVVVVTTLWNHVGEQVARKDFPFLMKHLQQTFRNILVRFLLEHVP